MSPARGKGEGGNFCGQRGNFTLAPGGNLPHMPPPLT